VRFESSAGKGATFYVQIRDKEKGHRSVRRFPFGAISGIIFTRNKGGDGEMEDHLSGPLSRVSVS
jgi:hypothetical protein